MEKPANFIPKRLPGRPRDESMHRAAIKATLEIIEEQGFDQLTFEAVAARARTSRPALYRRWKKKEHLIAEALETRRPLFVVPDTGSLRSDLDQAAADFIAQYATPLGRQAILDILKAAAQHKPVARAWAANFGMPRADSFRVMFTRAVARGELSASADIDTMMLILSSVLLQSCLLKDLGAKLSGGKNINAVIELVLKSGTPV